MQQDKFKWGKVDIVIDAVVELFKTLLRNIYVLEVLRKLCVAQDAYLAM